MKKLLGLKSMLLLGILACAPALQAGPQINVGVVYDYLDGDKGTYLKRVFNGGDSTAFVRISIMEIFYDEQGNISEQPLKDRGDSSKANDIFERLVKLDAAFEEEHKHLFNEFGINLRKNKMLDQSMEYYQRAMELSKKDENLFYNIARVYLEKKDFHKTVSCLLQAMELNPELDAGLKFLQWMKEKSLVPADQAEAVDAVLASASQ